MVDSNIKSVELTIRMLSWVESSGCEVELDKYIEETPAYQ